MIGRNVVRYEIQDQANTSRGQTLAQQGQFFPPTQANINRIGTDRVRRADNIIGGEIRQRAPVLRLQIGMLLGNPLPGNAAFPYSHEPDGFNAPCRQCVEHRIRY